MAERLIVELDVTVLLDEMDAWRRKHKNDSHQDYDHAMRVACAMVAEKAGIKSRVDWTEMLAKDETTAYSKFIHAAPGTEDRTKCNADIFERLAQYEDSGFKPEDLYKYRQLENELAEASETTLLELHEWLKSKKTAKQKKEVLIVKDRHDILNTPAVAQKYPRLYGEVFEHEQSSGGERCALTPEAYSEWKNYRVDETIEYRK